MERATQTLGLILAVALVATACSSEPEETPPEPSVAAAAQAPVMQPKSDGPYGENGTLRPAPEKVLGAPIPREMGAVSGSDSWAGYQAPYGYRTLVQFYSDELGSSWKATRNPGGVKFENESTGGAVYVQRPRSASEQPRVFYFGKTDDVKRPPTGLAKDATPRPGSGGAAPGSSAGGAGGGSGGGQGSASSDNYNKTVEKRDGRDVIVYTPKDERDAARGGGRDDLSRHEKGPGFNPFAGPRVHSSVPEGVLY